MMHTMARMYLLAQNGKATNRTKNITIHQRDAGEFHKRSSARKLSKKTPVLTL
jgi:hypothetical protein